jgi:Leucine-rich repeat (LRR) protein
MKHIYLLFVFFIVFVSCSPPEPVEIPDPNLAAAVREALSLDPNEPITQKKLDELKTLSPRQNGIRDLTGIEKMMGLTSLSLGSGQIADITPLIPN